MISKVKAQNFAEVLNLGWQTDDVSDYSDPRAAYEAWRARFDEPYKSVHAFLSSVKENFTIIHNGVRSVSANFDPFNISTSKTSSALATNRKKKDEPGGICEMMNFLYGVLQQEGRNDRLLLRDIHEHQRAWDDIVRNAWRPPPDEQLI